MIRYIDLTPEESAEISNFKTWLIGNSHTEATITGYVGWLKRYLAWLRDHKVTDGGDLRCLLEDYTRAYQGRLPASKWALVNALNKYLQFKNPDLEGKLRIRLPPLVLSPRHPPDAKTMRNMILNQKRGTGKSSFKTYAIICTLALTGLRAMELCNLRMERLRRSSDGSIIAILADRKWGHRHEVPVSSVLAGIWERWILEFREPEESAYLFPGRHGRRFSYAGLWKTVKRVGAMIHPELHPHLLRHWFATELIRQKEALSDVKELMAHKSLSSLGRYLHSDFERQRACVDALGRFLLNHDEHPDHVEESEKRMGLDSILSV